jgi:two-component system phosphate regulon sensor histidine kinase PhoR
VGTGRFAMHFPNVIGVDPAANALKMAEKRGVKVIQAYGENLPFEDNTFGCILIIATLCFVEDPLKVLKEAKRVLRPDGSIIIGIIPKDSPWGTFYEEKKKKGHPFYSKARFYTFNDVKGMIKESGLAIARIRSTLLQIPDEPKGVEEPVEGYFKGAGFLCLEVKEGDMKKEQIYDVIVNNLPVGFSMVDKDGIIVEFNPAAERITGYHRTEMIGKSHLDILHSAFDEDSCPLCKHALMRHEQTIETETTIRKKSSEPVSLTVTAYPFFDDAGNFAGGVELFRDITEIKRMERERKNILSMFAHDMKNPVTTSGGFLSRLLSGKAGPLTEKQQSYLEIMREELNRLLDLITEFLDFSRFETKEYKPVLGQFNIETDIYKNIEAARIQAEAKGVKLLVDFPETLLPMVNADEMMIDRVIRNRLDNAIKYTNPGGTITMKLIGREHDILVQVSDTGIGISENHLPYIFDAFYRISKDSKGSGLGLAITKSIIEAHGGRIWVESAEGKGSTFRFTLPK